MFHQIVPKVNISVPRRFSMNFFSSLSPSESNFKASDHSNCKLSSKLLRGSVYYAVQDGFNF